MVKNFIQIALSHTISEINVFWHFAQKFKMATTIGGKLILGKVTSRPQNFVDIALSSTVSEINAFLCFTRKFKMAAKKWWEKDFWEKLPVDFADTLRGPR